MSRRNQSRRRRSYGRRQHEVRERRAGRLPQADGLTAGDAHDWLALDAADARLDADESSYTSYAR